MDNNIKCVIVGDPAVGKTCLSEKFSTKKFPEEYIPRVADNKSIIIDLDGTLYTLELWDTHSVEESCRPHRPLSYPHTDLFLACFSITDLSSFENIRSTWLPELRHYAPTVPIFLVGTKSDLRNDDDLLGRFVSVDDMCVMAEELGFLGFAQCSALTGEGVTEMFENAVRGALRETNSKWKKAGCGVI